MDLLIFEKIIALRFELLNLFAVFFGKYLGYLLILLALAFFFKKRKIFYKAFLSAFISRFFFASLINFVWHRPRPFVEHDVNVLIEHAPTASFPSGHAAFFFGLAAAIFIEDRKKGIFFLIGAFLVSFFRVYSGIHWPADILAGAAVGVLSAFLVSRFRGIKSPKR